MNWVDLERADVHNAQCILVLVNNLVMDKQAEVVIIIFVVYVKILFNLNRNRIFIIWCHDKDMEAMMTAISLTSNRHEYGGGEQRLLVGLNLPNSETHMRQAGFTNALSEVALTLNILSQVRQ